jgi:hypothetical protein
MGRMVGNSICTKVIEMRRRRGRAAKELKISKVSHAKSKEKQIKEDIEGWFFKIIGVSYCDGWGICDGSYTERKMC